MEVDLTNMNIQDLISVLTKVYLLCHFTLCDQLDPDTFTRFRRTCKLINAIAINHHAHIRIPIYTRDAVIGPLTNLETVNFWVYLVYIIL